MMKRDQCLKSLVERRTGEAVVAVWQAGVEWEEYSKGHPLNFTAVRTMGECSTFALGLALARPDLKVIALEGDGSLLMNLAGLVTIAAARPKNFVQFIFQNGIYETTGGQCLPNVEEVNFAGIARNCGYEAVYDLHDFETYETELDDILASEGPVIAILHVEAGERHTSAIDWGSKVRSRDLEVVSRFKRALNAKC